jgi:hypothetical protein
MAVEQTETTYKNYMDCLLLRNPLDIKNFLIEFYFYSESLVIRQGLCLSRKKYYI